MYMTTVEDLHAALKTAHLHTKPGGIALFVPDYVTETFEASTDHGGHDQPDSRKGLRYLEWEWDPDPSDTELVSNFAYLLRHEDGSCEVVYDRHRWGLFTRKTWTDLLAGLGFQVEIVLDEEEGRDIFVGRG